MELRGLEVLVVGMARTGRSLARFLTAKGARVTVTDTRGPEEFSGYAAELEARGCRTRFGGHKREDFLRAELIVISPGVPLSMPLLQEARWAGREIMSEVEFASRFITVPLLGVTGTNGKTTVVSVIGAMLERGGRRAFVGGNIGRPLVEYLNERDLDGGPEAEVVVAELSSFQLEAIDRFRPWVAVVLNITEDHLDRYRSFEEYVRAKLRIFENQGPDDYAVVPAHAPWEAYLSRRVRSTTIRFGLGEDAAAEVGWSGGTIRWRRQDSEETYSTARMKLTGLHNIENMMAAVVAARLCNVPPPVIQDVIDQFPGLEHRLEMVCEVDGVRFYNDSKGTTVASVVRALESFESPIILIAGGKDKGMDFTPLRPLLERRVKHLFLLGEARDRMARELAGTTDMTMVESLEEAVERSWDLAAPHDVVLLSPACSSFDMFEDYEERGRVYKKSVMETVQRGRTGR